jgi:hypothetical protein
VGLNGVGQNGVASSSVDSGGGAGSVQFSLTAFYGGGGAAGYDTTSGGSGACRIVWGAGCAYPNAAGPSCFTG